MPGKSMNKIIEIKFGSHLYGTDTPNSDLDLKAIYLPEAREICLGRVRRNICSSRPKQPFERNTKDDIDIEIFSLGEYLKLLLEGQTMALDMLFALQRPEMVQRFNRSDLFDQIYENRFKLLNRQVNAFLGYARQQASKYGVKGFRVHALRETLEFFKSFPEVMDRVSEHGDKVRRFVKELNNEHVKITVLESPDKKPLDHLEVCSKYLPFTGTIKNALVGLQKRFDAYGHRALLAERNEGCDWKALSHAVRVNSEAKELLLSGFITFPRPDRELLIKVKTGQMPYKAIAEIIESGLEELEELRLKSILRDKPDYEWADDFLYSVYKGIVNG
jgi:hypothetical protein